MSAVTNATATEIAIPHATPRSFALPAHPHRTCLIMIDLQGDFLDTEHSFLAAMGASDGAVRTQRAVEPAARVLHAARQAGIRIIHTLEAHLANLNDLSESKNQRTRIVDADNEQVIGQEGGNGRMLTRGSPCNGLVPAVAMQDGEVALHKPGKGAFCNTELLARLEAWGVTHLLVTGVTTECCVQTTLREANDRGLNSLLVTDATASCFECFETDTMAQLTSYGGIVCCAAQSMDVEVALNQLEAAPTEAPLLPISTTPTPSPATPRLPIINVAPLVRQLSHKTYSAARRAVDTDCLAVAEQLDQACRTVGFFYVTGHGLEAHKQTLLEENMPQLFGLDSTVKETALRASAGEGAGYEPSGAQTLDEGRLGESIDGESVRAGDRKESYIIGKSVPSQRVSQDEDRIEGRWPPESENHTNDPANFVPVGFKDDLIRYHDACEEFLRTLLRGIALGLGLAADTFDCFTVDSMTKLRLLRYPAYSEDRNGYAVAHGCGSHCDWGALTLLAQDDVGGLEVYTPHAGWLPAPNQPGALLINVGDMLQLWTAGRYRSAPHRVVRPATTDTKPRYSAAVFYNCDHNARIDPRILWPNQEMDLPGAIDKPVFTAEEYILERVKGTYNA